ncbi:MAG: PocR ligand-binding domain-containing protein [bacterium]|nr:PocR ligand-binding domain-containing protein [bacterium]
MSQLSLHKILNTKTMRDFRLIFYEITGMVTSLYFPAWKSQVDMLPHNAKCRFCSIIQSTPEGRELCRNSDARVIETIKTKRKPFVHRCHTAGLTGIAVPIYFGDTAMGTVFAGDVLAHKQSKTHFTRITRKLKGLDLDFEELEKAYYEIPLLPQATIGIAVKLLSLIVNYIVDREQIIHLQTTLFEKQQAVADALSTRLVLERDLQAKVDEMAKLRKYLLAATNAGKVILSADNEETTQKRIIKDALAFIDDYYAEQIRLKDVAGHVNMSPNYLSTLFHKECGCTFAEYLAQKRIGKACRLLEDPKMNINEVGIQVGYYNPSYFTQIFKKLAGVSPGDYRKRIELQ